MIKEFLLNPPFGERGWFLCRACVCAIMWVLWDERNRRVFRAVEREARDIWSLVCFHVSGWALISKVFLAIFLT